MPYKLTSNQVSEIHELIKKGMTQKDIASKYNVSPMSISKVKNNTLHTKKLKGIVVQDVRGVLMQI